MADMSWRFEYWILFMMKIWERYDQDVMMQIWRVTVKTIMIWWQCEDISEDTPTSTIFSPTSGSFFLYIEVLPAKFSQVGQQYQGPGMALNLALQWSGWTTNWYHYWLYFFVWHFFFGVEKNIFPSVPLIGASGQSCLGEWIRFALESQGRGMWCGNVKAPQSKLTDVFQQVLLFMSFFCRSMQPLQMVQPQASVIYAVICCNHNIVASVCISNY